MDKFTVASVQMRMRLPGSVEEYRDELRRYLRAADAKRARLVLFPELAGLMLAPLLLRDRRTALLRQAERARRRNAGAWERARGRAAGWAATLLKADLYAAFSGLLEVEPGAVWALYQEIFGKLAKAHGVTIVAPSAYLPDVEGGVLENRCALFGPNGDLLGVQSKILGYAEDERLVQRGSSWLVIPTELGQAGIILGSDVLYPEVGRLLAFQGADFLLVQAACPSPAFYNKVRAGTLARMQDNQLFAASSFVVGDSPLRARKAEEGRAPAPYVGRSAVFAPQELTQRANGVLVEMGGGASEGVVTAEWDFVALRHLWETSDTPLRRALPAGEAAQVLGALYAQLRALPQPPQAELLADDEGEELTTDEAVEVTVMTTPANGDLPAVDDSVDLVMLPLLGAVTSRWPLAAASDETSVLGEQLLYWPSPQPADKALPTQIRREDETDEMDAVESGRLPLSPEDESPTAPTSP